MTRPSATPANPGYAYCRCGAAIEFIRLVGWVHAGETPCVEPVPSSVVTESFSVTCTAFAVAGGNIAHGGPCPVHPEASR